MTADHHHHWHTMGMESYQLLGLDAPISGETPVGHKYGFCFFDGIPWKLGLPNARSQPHFSYFGCGFPTSQTTLVGLSVGWSDIYPWDFAGQYIDLSGVPDGDYLLCMTADPANDFVESSDTDNQSWAHVTLSGTATPTPTMVRRDDRAAGLPDPAGLPPAGAYRPARRRATRGGDVGGRRSRASRRGGCRSGWRSRSEAGWVPAR